MFRARFLQIARRFFRFCFRLVPFLAQPISLRIQDGQFRCQNGDARFAFEQRFLLCAAPPAENDSFHGNEFAGQCRRGKMRRSFFETKRVIEILEDCDVMQQLADKRLKYFRCINLVGGPCDCALRQNFSF